MGAGPTPRIEPDESSPGGGEGSELADRATTGIPLGPVTLGESPALTVLAILAVGYTLAIGKPVFVPITIALLFYFILSPLLRRLTNAGLPKSFGAFLIVASVIGSIAVGLWQLAEPAQEWIRDMPQSLDLVREKLESLRRPMVEVASTAKQMDELAGVEDPDSPEPVVVETHVPNRVFANITGIVGQLVIITFMLFLLLAGADDFLRSLVRVLPNLHEKKIAVGIIRGIERDISRYLVTITIINTVLGVAIGVAMSLLGMPNAILWGVMGGLLNYVPYVGAFVGAVVVGIVAILSFDSLIHAFAVPAAFVSLTAIEGMGITPWILGQRLRMSSVATLVSLIVLGWMWGVAGTLVAVPILVMIKILCDNVPVLAPWGEFLAREGTPTAVIEVPPRPNEASTSAPDPGLSSG